MSDGNSRGGRRAKSVLSIAAALGATAALPAVGHAQNRWWVDGVTSGNWNNPANWAVFQSGAGGAGVPTSVDIARILHNNASNYNVTLDPGLTTTVNALLIGNGGAGTSTLTQNGAGGITTLGFFGVGSASGGGTTPKAVVNHSAGTNTIHGLLQIGLDPGSVGTYNLGGTGQIVVNNSSGGVRIGVLGAGTMNHTGGALQLTTPIIVGYESASSGIYNLGGTGVVNTPGLYVGYNNSAAGAAANGQFIQTGGGIDTFEINVGGKSGGNGSYSLSAGTVTASSVQVGVNIAAPSGTATGTFTQNGGTHTVGGELRVGVNGGNSSGTGIYNLSGGAVSSATTVVGKIAFTGTGLATGSFAQTGGTHTTDNLRLGEEPGAAGAYTLSAGTLLVATDAWIGDNGNGGPDGHGTFVHTGGTHSVGHALSIGAGGTAPTGSGRYTISGDAQLTVGGGIIVNGTFAQNGGTVASGGAPTVPGEIRGLVVGGAAPYNLNAGTLAITGVEIMGSGFGSGTFNQTGGTHTLGQPGDNATVLLGVLAATGTYNLSGAGGVFTVNGSVQLGVTDTVGGGGGTGVLNVSNGTMTVTRAITIGNAAAQSRLNLTGGTLTVGSITGDISGFHWTGGTLRITGPEGLAIGTDGGIADLALTPSMHLAANVVTVSGAGALSFDGGTADIALIRLAAGTIDGTAAFANAGQIAGNGTIAGSGGFTNSGAVIVDSGTLTVSRTGALLNTGAIDVAGGARLQLDDANLANSGVITIAAGGRLAGGATVNNNNGGVIAGSGTIAAPMTNQAGGTILVQVGTLRIEHPMGNAGTINLAGPASTLAGAPVTNNGVVRGDGIVNNTLANASSGEIRAEAGKSITIVNMPGPNTGRVSLHGGTAQFDAALTNATGGTITGRGTLRANAGMTNNGQVNLIGGLSDVFGNITSTSGSRITVSADATAIFYNPITLNSGSEFRVNAGSTAVFFGNVNGAAGAFTGSGTKQFEEGASALGGIATAGETVVQTAASLTAGHVRDRALTVDGLVTITPNAGPAGTSNIAELTIGSAGRVDLKDNKLVTSTPAGAFNGSAYSGVQGEVARAYNFGSWDQPGLMTSELNAGPNAGILSGTTTIGVATAEQVMFIGPSDTGVFMGQAVTGASTIAMYTYAGDLNFDGLVDGADYGTIDNFVQFPGTDGYVNGDINYDGVIDGADYGIIDNTVQLQGAPFPGVFSAAAAAAAAANALPGVTAVPEPSAWGIAVLGAGAFLARRRRRRSCAIPGFSSPAPDSSVMLHTRRDR